MVSPPIFSTRLPLHSLSPAGLPKYDLSSGLAREADKSPLRTKFGCANSTALATHAPRLASPNMALPQDEASKARSSVCQQRGNEMENPHPRRHTPASARRRRRTLAYVNELAYFGALPCAAVAAAESRFGRLFSTIDNAVNAGLASSSASTHRPSNFPCSRAFPVIHISFSYLSTCYVCFHCAVPC